MNQRDRTVLRDMRRTCGAQVCDLRVEDRASAALHARAAAYWYTRAAVATATLRYVRSARMFARAVQHGAAALAGTP